MAHSSLEITFSKIRRFCQMLKKSVGLSFSNLSQRQETFEDVVSGGSIVHHIVYKSNCISYIPSNQKLTSFFF